MQFFVSGIPAPQGSKRHVGNGIMVEQAGPRLRAWREAVRYDCSEAFKGTIPADGPIGVTVVFHMPRPRGHFVASNPAKGLKKNAPMFHDKMPDIDKLIRSTLDGLKSGGAYRDDSQVAAIAARKSYAVERVGAWVTVQLLAIDEHPGVVTVGPGI